MSASKQAKKGGLESLAEMSRITGRRVGVLRDWHKNYPSLFKALLIGCKSIKDEGESHDKAQD